MKHITLNTVITFIALFIVSAATAQNARLKKPLTVTDNGQTVTICYDISGLGNVTEVQMTITYDANVSSECFNPGNKDESVPGQNKFFADNSEEFTVPVHNGRAIGCYESTKVFPAGGCPSSSWTGVVTDVTFSGVTLTVLGKTFTAN